MKTFLLSIGMFLALMLLAGCAHRASAPIEQTVPAKAATSTAAQSAEIAPLILTATGVGIAAAGAGVYLKSEPLVTSGIAVSVGALTLQRFLPWIPWLIATGMAYLAIRYAIKHHLLLGPATKDRAKLKQVANTVAIAAVDGTKAPTFASLADDLAEHLK